MTLQKETDIPHKTIATAWKVLSCANFDKQSIAQVSVGDHQQTYDRPQKVQKNAKGPVLKAHAQKAVQGAGQHLDTAKKWENKK
jgi:hypothetical protein